MTHRLAVLISGAGTNLQAILDAIAAGDLPARVTLVLSNRAGAPGLARAERAGLSTAVINHRDYGENTLLVERCRQQGIFEPDWYKRVKTILFQQGVIATDLTLDALQEAKHHAHASTPVSA